MDDLLERVQQGDRRALARAITQIERGNAREIISKIYAKTGSAHIVGVTGAPGSGKSTLVNHLARKLRERELRVGIIAVDPSSPFSGGALLGDRIRMQDLAGDEGIFIRSMASRGNLGGLASATSAVAKVLDAAGFDVILIETVGAGQAEVSIAATAHTTIVVEAPGMGDDVQSIKAGILEIADILVVNKADRPGAAVTVKGLRLMLHMGQDRKGSRIAKSAGSESAADGSGQVKPWRVDVYETVATVGEGVSEVIDAILAHRAYLEETGLWFRCERERSRQEIEQLLQAHLVMQMQKCISVAESDQLIHAVANRDVDPYAAAAELIGKLFPDC